MFIYTGVINLYRHELYRDLQRSLREDNEEARFSDIHTHFSYILEKKLTQTGIGEIFELINFGITLILIFYYLTQNLRLHIQLSSVKTIFFLRPKKQFFLLNLNVY